MNKKSDLTQGNIFISILFLALPIMGTSFMQMAYNLVDMIWIGKLGDDQLAAVGTAGFLVWFSTGLIYLCKIGAEVLVAQSVGAKNEKRGKQLVQNVIPLTLFLGVFLAIIYIIFNNQLINFFNIPEANVVEMAKSYLKIVAIGLPFFFINPILTAIFNGSGKSFIPFVINLIGLVFNMIFDPLLIFGVGPFPALGVEGAAIATISSQSLVTIVFVVYIKRQKGLHLFEGFRPFKNIDLNIIKKLVKIGFPVGFQSMLFTLFAMIIAKILADWGAVAIAVQKVGSQIESLSWMTAVGFSSATSTFVGQNFGAGKNKRIYKGYFMSITIMAVFGFITSCILIFLGGPIFSIFSDVPSTIKEGAIYLRILGYSQLFMCIEIVTNGAFNGLGKTMLPAVNSSIFNFLRIPAALILSSTALSLSGVWWSVSISSMFKGVVIVTAFAMLLLNMKKDHLFDTTD